MCGAEYVDEEDEGKWMKGKAEPVSQSVFLYTEWKAGVILPIDGNVITETF